MDADVTVTVKISLFGPSSPLLNTHRDLCCLSSLDSHSRKHGLQYTYRDGFDSTGFRIVRGYGYRFGSTGDERQRQAETDVAAKNS
jgi:hypothetical protein